MLLNELAIFLLLPFNQLTISRLIAIEIETDIALPSLKIITDWECILGQPKNFHFLI